MGSAGEQWVRTIFPGESAAFDELLEVMKRREAAFAERRATSFDHAATSAPTALTLAAAALANLALPANANSVHQSGILAQKVAGDVRGELARMLMQHHSDKDWVAFTDGGSAANDLAMRVLPHQPKRISGSKWKNVLLVGAMEHPSVLSRAAAMEAKGYKVVQFPCTADGVYDTDAFRVLVKEHADRICFFTAHHVNNEVGTVQPIAELVGVLREASPGAIAHADCVQSFGRERVDLSSLGVDVISIAFHKVGGPKRCGALVASREGVLPARFRDTPDIAAMIASVAAAKDALAAVAETRMHCQAIRARIASAVAARCEQMGVICREAAPADSCVAGVLTFVFPGLQGRHLVTMLGDAGFDLSAGAACAAQNDGPSHVLQAMHINRQDCYAALRLSFSRTTTEDSADRLVNALGECLVRLKPVQEREMKQRQYKDEGRQGRKRKESSPCSTSKPSEPIPPKHPRKDAPTPPATATVAEAPAAAGEPAKSRMPLLSDGCGHDAVMVCMGEVVLKGGNRQAFERQLLKNIKLKLASNEVTKDLYLWTPAGYPHAGFLLLLYLADEDKPKGGPSQCSKLPVPRPDQPITSAVFSTLRSLLLEVSGIANFAPVLLAQPDWQSIRQQGLKLLRMSLSTLDAPSEVAFGVAARRAKDTRGGGVSMTSEQIQRELGGDMMDAAEAEGLTLTVDLKNPQLMFEVRARVDCALVFCRRDRVSDESGGGLPDGSDGDGRVLCLLSGGHDSPVAAQKIMGRGCRVGFVHFDGYPFTGAEIVDKVRKLQSILNRHQAKAQMLLVVPFSSVQEKIANTRGVCASYRTVLYRVFFFKMASILARRWRFRALATGDNLGQVASQTLANMAALDRFSDMVVLRPLVTWTKREIMDHANKIGTAETSALHGTVDCCTVFKPCNPVLRIDDKHLQTQLQRLQEAGIDDVVEAALARVTVNGGAAPAAAPKPADAAAAADAAPAAAAADAAPPEPQPAAPSAE
eukprot:TRINITY_DN35612_c0_g1_i1.p1 TRINITY_DN35612_c0_g1~~TRINITY_DN35612_c0_g1_i1.p1  ORF type:complete len:1008 (+),score=316.80 TRINITY_DN35612_c0_g1_i1:72-3026(+)